MSHIGNGVGFMFAARFSTIIVGFVLWFAEFFVSLQN